MRRSSDRQVPIGASSPRKSILRGIKERLSSWRVGAALLVASTSLMGLSAAPTYAATGMLYAGGLDSPSSFVWMGSRMWISDHLQGFCRLDPSVSGTFAINPATCDLTVPAPGQASYDPATNFVYLPDGSTKSQGVWRLTFDPATETVGNAVLLAPGKGLGGAKATSAVLGPDRQLYVGFVKSGNIDRVTNPAGDPATQQVQAFGGTSDGRGSSGMTFIGNDLYIAEGAAVSKIANATTCISGCHASPTPIQTADPAAIAAHAAVGVTPTAISSDGVNTIYVADTPFTQSRILRYTLSTKTLDVYADSGIAPDGKAVTFNSVAGLAIAPSGNLFVGEGAPDSPSGHVWEIPAGSAPISTISTGGGTGGGGAITPALTTSSLYVGGVTAPKGQLSMGSHLWVSDRSRGLCRLDGPAADGTFAINATTCSTAAPIPGQAAYDAATNFVYVPDMSANSQGVWRLSFNPATETVGNPFLLAPGKGLGGNQPDAVALGPDGNLYVSFVKNGNIWRVTTPAAATQIVQSMGGSLSSASVSHMAFIGSDLYLVEPTKVSKIVNATSALCTGGCKAVASGISAAGPTAIAAYGANVLYIANGPDVLRYTISSKSQVTYTNKGIMPNGTSATFRFIGGLSVDSAGNLFIGDDPSNGTQTGLGHVWKAPLVP